jgi:hypothetical protein
MGSLVLVRYEGSCNLRLWVRSRGRGLVATQFRDSKLMGAFEEGETFNMVISSDSSSPLVRLRVMRSSLRKLHPFNKRRFSAGDVAMVNYNLVFLSRNSSSYLFMRRRSVWHDRFGVGTQIRGQ